MEDLNRAAAPFQHPSIRRIEMTLHSFLGLDAPESESPPLKQKVRKGAITKEACYCDLVKTVSVVRPKDGL